MSDYDTTVGVQLTDDFSQLMKDLPRIISRMKTLRAELSSISNFSLKTNGFTQAINNLKKLSSMDNIDKQMQNISKTISSMNFTNIKSLREELAKMKQEYANFLSMMNRYSGNKLKKSNVYNSVRNKDFNSTGMNDLRGTKNQNVTSYINNMKEGLSDVDKTAQRTKKSITSMFSLGKVYWFLNYTKQAFRGLGNVMQSALDFTEIENYFSRAMGNMYDKAMSFQNKLGDMYGLAQTSMMQAQATYKNMIGSLGGLSEDMSYNLSETVTKMTLDFSSLYNVDFDKTVQKFQSALSKQVRPIRSVSGFDITQSVLGGTASSIGITRTVSKMNELEKRMLIILTLMNQMRNSGAMNDLARTIEQPSNQLRIFKEQVIEVGRWLGSVFYGVIGKILPYINGFMMAIKEIMRTFALFVGYELPNSSGQTGTILDSYGDSMNDFSNGIGNANSGLDDAKKKAKELKGSLASFDKLNIINKPTDDTSSNSGSTGTGGMTVDPKILDALNKYKYIFDDIHMRATDIRDEMLKWANIASKAFNDNIFKPIQSSWNKYGASILQNAKDTFMNIGGLAGGIFDVVGEKWKPFFKSASDLFLSLVDTASLITSSITEFFKDVWNKGGNVFLEGIFDIATALMKLATSINDNFIKPTVRAFKDTFGVVISSIIGTILKLIGSFMTELSKFISLITRSQPIVKGLGVTLAGVFTVIQIGKLSQLWGSFADGTGKASKLLTILVEKSKTMDKLFTMYVNGGVKFGNLKDAWKSGISTISSFVSKIKTQTATMLTSKTATEGATVATGGLTIAQKLCAGATTLLKSALDLLSKHPFIILGVAITTAIIALASFSKKAGETTKKIEDCSQEIQDQAQEIKEYSDAVDSAVKSADDQVHATEAQIGMTEKYISKLKGLSDEKGYVDNIEQAKFLVDEINKVLPDTFEITEDGRVIQKKSNDELQKSITLTKDQAKARAYQEAYIEILKNQLITEQKLNDQKAEYAKLMEDAEKQYADYIKTAGAYNDEQVLTFEQWIKGNDALQDLGALIETTTTELGKYSGQLGYVEKKMGDLTDTMGETIKTNGKLSDSTQKAFDNIGKSGQNNINDVIKGLSSYGKKLKEASANTSKYSKEELITLQKSRSDKVVEYGKMVRDYDLSYDQIIEIARNSGIDFSLQEQGTLASIVEVYKNGGKQAGDDYVTKLSKGISDGSLQISNSAKGNVLDTNEILKNVPVEYESMVKSAIEKAQKVRQDAQDNAGNINLNVNTTINWSRLKTQIEQIKKDYMSKLDGRFVLSVNGQKQEESVALLKWKGFAKGGFPDVGQMFIANEAGPELVGRMGRRTAVANNDQIVGGIADGVYRAVVDANSAVGSNNKDQYVKVYVVLDGKIIDERIEKANDEHVLMTGKPLFIK